MISTEPAGIGEDLFTINAAGYSATADAFARDPDTGGLWFLSMVGPQTALKAIWASLLKQPPDAAYIIRGIEGMALSVVATSAARSPITPSAPGPPASPACPPAGDGTRSCTRAWPNSSSSGTTSCCWPRTRPTRRGCTTASWTGAAPCPCTARWRDWLWRRGLDTGEIVPLESAGLLAYTCNPRGEELKADLSAAVAAGTLTLNSDDNNDMEEDSDG